MPNTLTSGVLSRSRCAKLSDWPETLNIYRQVVILKQLPVVDQGTQR